MKLTEKRKRRKRAHIIIHIKLELAVRKFDEAIIKYVQEFYLWLWDWTGIYLPTVWFIVLSIDLGTEFLLFDKFRFMIFVLFAFFGVYCGLYYALQDTRKYQQMNAVARYFQEGVLRIVMTVMLLCFAVNDIVERDWHVISALACIAFFYLRCVQLRDREPKDFFRKVVAMGAS
jgi:hypothetical protein